LPSGSRRRSSTRHGILAAKRSTSISRLVAEEIERLVAADDAYEHARQQALAELDRGYDLGSGGRLPDRSATDDR
jgi:hypothetical protein